MKEKHILAHMKTAFNYAECSGAVRLKVGAIIVKDDNIISFSWNGQPSGWDNVCEDKIYMGGTAGGWLDEEEIEEQWPFVDDGEKEYFNYNEIEGYMSMDDIKKNYPMTEGKGKTMRRYRFNTMRRYKLKTKSTVLHAETNALSKLAKYHGGGLGASLFVTHAPCLPCALATYQAGITSVYYAETYRDSDGIEFLLKCNIPVIKLDV